MKGKHFRKRKKTSIKTKSIILSLITVVELLLLATTLTFSWFEGLTSLEMSATDISTYDGLKSEFIIGEGSGYQNTAKLNEFFDAQANGKLSPVSSYNGEDFYALYEGEATSYAEYLSGIVDGSLKFRKLSEEDINSNVIYFQFKVTAATSDTTFWLKEMPTVKINGTALTNAENPFRIRIDDGTGQASSNEGNLILTSKESWPTGHYTTSKSRKNMLAVKELDDEDNGMLKGADDVLCNRATYKVFNSDASSINKNGNEILFTVSKGETKTITIAIWLEALDQSYSETLIPPGATVDIDMKFCSSWDVTDTITCYDYTADQWVDTTDENQNDVGMSLCVRNLDDTDTGVLYDFTYNETNKTWTGEIPRALTNCEFVWMKENNNKTESANWNAYSRSKNTEISLFGSDDYIWGIGSDDVVKIALSDYTGSNWLNNLGDDGLLPKMRIQINYNNKVMNYSMTDIVATDKNGRNTWYAYIPSSIQDVRFDRCDRSDNTIIYNYWNGTDRGTETVYRATDSGTQVEDETVTVYLYIPAEHSSFYFGSSTPAISLTSTENVATIQGLSDLSTLEKSAYITKDDGADEWINSGIMTKISDNLYSFSFDSLPEGTYLTFWNRSQEGYNDVSNDTHFAPAIQFTPSKGNMLTITNPVELTDSEFINSYIYEGVWSNYGTGGDSSTEDITVSVGEWGEAETLTGTAVNFKHYSTSTETITASFTYGGLTYSVDLNKGSDSLTWTTTCIPDSVTSVTFSDGTNTWSTSSRSTTNNYYYAVSSSKGLWNAEGYVRIYFTDNYSWSNIHIYYWGGSSSTSWPGNSMTKVASNEQSQDVYAALVPSNSTGIIFNSGNNGYQTKDITSNITDMKGFYISGGSGTTHTASTWDVDASFLDTYSN